MGNFINKIKNFFFASEKKNESQLVLKSYAVQVIDHLQNSSSVDTIDTQELYDVIRRNFDYSSICELDNLLCGTSESQFVYSFLKKFEFDCVIKNSHREFEEIKINSSTTEYLAFLLGVKKKMIGISHLINIQKSIHDVDTRIIQQAALLEKYLEEPVSVRDAFGYFFIYEKEVAQNLFVNYLSNSIKKAGGYPNLVMCLHNTLDDLRIRLDMNFIPVVTHLNFRSKELFKFNALINNSFEEIYKISKIKEYFLQSIPLQDFKEEELINVAVDCCDIGYIKFILYEFFKFICKDEFYFEDKNVFEFFWSNCTEKTPSFSKLELNYAHSLLNRLVVEDRQNLYYIVAIFLYFKNGDLITRLPSKLPKILAMYFGVNSLKERTIYELLTRDTLNNKSFNKDNSYINDWAVIKQKKYTNPLVDSGVY
ncbi:hypothetical protein [Myroides odoratimimus]|uniref:hypothetical protein n=1 Tax=Myroides odoratimimus TaxID=76832 RepID=UPI002577E92A|nr:hypothetical protein [Myroides odoratimimus]MDM1453899.1 hypothetical protein [Myroides odoratimimus]MDM1477621.1 hypothetical protein [Myroides odoratimimus]MDM1490015.1 hypothetical protein [Myroides odoratimimus]